MSVLTPEEEEAQERFAGAGRSRSFRRRVRARIAETGEPYRAARIRLLLEAERARIRRSGGGDGAQDMM